MAGSGGAILEPTVPASRPSPCEPVGSGFDCYITGEYLNLKLQELWLVQAYHEQLQAEMKEQRQIKQQMREEQREQKEIERALKESQREAERYQQALEKARAEVGQAQGAKQQKLVDWVAEMEAKLREAEEQWQRSLSMAQQGRRAGCRGADLISAGLRPRAGRCRALSRRLSGPWSSWRPGPCSIAT